MEEDRRSLKRQFNGKMVRSSARAEAMYDHSGTTTGVSTQLARRMRFETLFRAIRWYCKYQTKPDSGPFYF